MCCPELMRHEGETFSEVNAAYKEQSLGKLERLP